MTRLPRPPRLPTATSDSEGRCTALGSTGGVAHRSHKRPTKDRLNLSGHNGRLVAGASSSVRLYDVTFLRRSHLAAGSDGFSSAEGVFTNSIESSSSATQSTAATGDVERVEEAEDAVRMLKQERGRCRRREKLTRSGRNEKTRCPRRPVP